MARLCRMIVEWLRYGENKKFLVLEIACASVWFVMRLHLVPGLYSGQPEQSRGPREVRAGGSLRQSESSLPDVDQTRRRYDVTPPPASDTVVLILCAGRR
ncbi:hypothetical protein SISSUDRAFT_1053889 [Sistotremastrum suecicum HHB10207 ss-3]|uniref:Uncharacterized protein n=1 Tax=Sistotremastrum suecicum HHB10207 ss-3 TaxID=1314776 RepID=A0A165YWX9_9AGAM|nr:hypothetical protein SISSUDRAFT_1053889 [Sistotremastrum suecicum HHB10207 ss-3]